MTFNNDDENVATIVASVERKLRLKALSHNNMYLYGIKKETELDVVFPLLPMSPKIASFLAEKGFRTAILKERLDSGFGLGLDLRKNIPTAVKVTTFIVYSMNGKAKFSSVDDSKIKFLDFLNPKPVPALDENGVLIPTLHPRGSSNSDLERILRDAIGRGGVWGVDTSNAILRDEPLSVVVDGNNREVSWVYPSRTSSNTRHTVSAVSGLTDVLSCSCMGFRTHGRCWHIDRTRARLLANNRPNESGGSH